MLNRLFQILRLFAPNRELANESQKLGELGERAAAGYLRKKRYKVVETNVTTSVGEIDLVAVDGRVVVFVEVKTRRSKKKGEPWEAVDLAKRKKLLHLAEAYLKREDLNDQRARFDIVSVTWLEGAHRPEIEHLIDAFGGDDV
jgi:putative endonuclease